MFITLEGIEGSGKTTQTNNIVRFLETRGHDCIVTREPGGTEIGNQIRMILLDPRNRNLSPLAELLLYAADRAQHLKEKIIPELSCGKTVVCDRFFDATTIYQGFARGLDMELIQNLHRIVLENLKPDLTILFDLPVKTGLSRAWKQINQGSRVNLETRFEKETLAFHERVRSGYLELARQEPDRIRIIDASHDVEKVYEDITAILAHKLENK